jgi:hypothetical protein
MIRSSFSIPEKSGTLQNDIRTQIFPLQLVNVPNLGAVDFLTPYYQIPVPDFHRGVKATMD